MRQCKLSWKCKANYTSIQSSDPTTGAYVARLSIIGDNGQSVGATFQSNVNESAYNDSEHWDKDMRNYVKNNSNATSAWLKDCFFAIR